MNRSWKKRPQVSHADDWLMTYADMITLLLCMFTMMLIVAITHKGDVPKTVQQMMAQPEVPQPREAAPQPPPPPPQPKLPDVFQTNGPFRPLRQSDFEPNIPHEETPAIVKTEPPQEPVAAPPPIPPSAQIEQQGDRITTIEMNSAAFFDRGSATLSEAGQTILQNVAANLSGEQYADYQITVEGHTDDTPISTAQFPSNWELSTARAAAVVNYFLKQGLPAQRLRAAGYADTFPKVPNRDAEGNAIPDNQAQNRRVVIKLEKIEKAAQ